MNKENFVGRHLLLDVKLKTVRGLAEVSYVYNLLEDLSKLMKMTLVYPPICARFPWASSELEHFNNELKNEGAKAETIHRMSDLLAKRNSDDAGVSGICVWLESHAALHTWTADLFFSFDAYSCKEFDAQKAVDFLLVHFDVESYNGLSIMRTINEPQKIKVIKG